MKMAFESIVNSITTFFNALANANNFVVRYDSDPRDTPADKAWMNISIEFKDSRQAEIGIKSFRNKGNFIVKVFISIGQGVADALSIADIIAAEFRTVVVDGTINFQTPTVRNVRRVGDNWEVDVICPFFVDN